MADSALLAIPNESDSVLPRSKGDEDNALAYQYLSLWLGLCHELLRIVFDCLLWWVFAADSKLDFAKRYVTS